MLHIFLDTSVFSAAPRRDNAAFKALGRMAESGNAKLHLSSVSLREFVTQQEAHFATSIAEAQSALRDIRRRTPTSEPLLPQVIGAESLLRSLELGLRESAKTGLPSWIAETGATVHSARPDHGERVLDAYFGGKPPFKTKKKRDDFPDAFIFTALADLVANTGEVHAVVVDKELRTSAAGLTGVTTYEGLDALVTSEPCQSLILAENTSRNIEQLRDCLRVNPSSLNAILERELVDALQGKQIESDYIPDDNSTATVSSSYSPQDVTFSLDDLDYYGDGLVVIPFTAEVEVVADYYVNKADYYVLDEARTAHMSVSDRDWNDHCMAVEEEFLLRIAGTIAMSIDDAVLQTEDVSAAAIGAALLGATGTVEEFAEVEVVVPSEDFSAV